MGVLPPAEVKTIKAVYRSLARKYHPDTSSGGEADAAKFTELTEAYEILIDPKRGDDYDTNKNVGGSASQSYQDKGEKFAADPEIEEKW